MLDNFLNKSKPINFVGLLILFFLCFFSTLFVTHFKGVFTSSKIAESLLLIAVLLFTFFLTNFIIVKNNLTFDNSYGFLFIVSLFILLLPEIITPKILLLNGIHLLILRKIYSLHSKKKVFEKVFDAGFWLGVFFILDPFSILYLLLLFIGIYSHKKLTINTLIIPILGFLVPVFVYFTYFYWVDELEQFYDLFDVQLNFYLSNYTNHFLFYPFVVVITFTLFSLFLKSSKALSVNNTFKKNWIILINNLAVALLFLLIHNTKSYGNVIFAVFPIALVLANGLEMIQKKIIRNAILYLFIFGAIALRFFL